MGLPYNILDVFTDAPFSGNPLAVVHNADGLDSERMQAIAREFNLSETVFVLTPTNGVHTAKIRIFTPQQELPFAGHPTIGTAILLAGMRKPNGSASQESLVLLEEQIGTVRVGVRSRPGQVDFAECDAPKTPQLPVKLADIDRVSAALGLMPAEIGFENHEPMKVIAGPSFAFVPIRDLESLAKAGVQQAHWRAAFSEDGIQGVFVYTRQCIRAASAFHGRMFAPDLGVPEDPATGSAIIGLARCLERFDGLTDGMHRRIIEQGYEMGRPSAVQLTMTMDAGRLTNVRIGGNAVKVMSGTIDV